MKVLLISNMYPDIKNPQYGIFVKNSEDILSENGILVEKIVCTKKNNKIMKIIQYILFHIKVLFSVLVKKYDYIYVHYLSYSSIGLIMAYFLGKKINIISNVHGSDVIPQNKKHEVLNKISKKCAEISKVIISPSNYFKNIIIDKWNISECKIVVYPSGGINNNIFMPKEVNNSFKNLNLFDSNFKYIGFVSRLESGKGWDVLLDSIYDLKDKEYINRYKFIFVGNGKDEEIFKNKVNSLGLNSLVFHLNFLNHKQLADLYNILEIFCFPTKANESLGLVGLEALACGIPVIASNFAGPTDYIIDSYNGYLFEKGNYKDLSLKIQEYILLSDDEKLNMKNNAYESSKNYWKNNVEHNLVNIFK